MTAMGNVGGNPLTQKFLDTSGVDEVRQWHGVYLAKITNTNDPLQQQRATLLVPQVLGNVASNWATPAFPLTAAPPVGATVLASFTGGDINRPMYMITPATSPTGVTILAGDIKLNGSSLNGSLTTINSTLTSLQSQISGLLSGNVTIGGNLTVNGTTGIKATNGNLNMNGNNITNINAMSSNGGNIVMNNGLNINGNNIDMQNGNINDIAALNGANGGTTNIQVSPGIGMNGNIDMQNNNINDINTMNGVGGSAIATNSPLSLGGNLNMNNNNINNAVNVQGTGTIGGTGAQFSGGGITLTGGATLGGNLQMAGHNIKDNVGTMTIDGFSKP